MDCFKNRMNCFFDRRKKFREQKKTGDAKCFFDADFYWILEIIKREDAIRHSPFSPYL